MRRHESLTPLTHDHHHALVQVRRLRAAADGSDDDRRVVAMEFLEFFHSDTIPHFREEEEAVFPLVVEDGDMRGTLERVMMQHLRIHSLVGKLEAECEQASPEPGTLSKLAATLEHHVRFEEKVVFPLIEERAANAALESVLLRPRQRKVAV